MIALIALLIPAFAQSPANTSENSSDTKELPAPQQPRIDVNRVGGTLNDPAVDALRQEHTRAQAVTEEEVLEALDREDATNAFMGRAMMRGQIEDLEGAVTALQEQVDLMRTALRDQQRRIDGLEDLIHDKRRKKPRKDK